MNPDLLPLLRCPQSGETLTLEDAQYDLHGELTSAALVSASGAYRYRIIDDVAELVPPLDAGAQRERDVRETWTYNPAVERARPYLDDQPEQSYKWRSRAANAEQGIAALPLTDGLILDLGAGLCWSTRMIAERGRRAVAFDLSTNSLRHAAAQFSAGVRFERVAGTMTRLPFADGVFAAAFTSAAIHHAEDLGTAFREISRVLRPGGVLVLSSEPTLGLLRRSHSFGADAIAWGMNEHIYRLGDYLRAARASGFHPQVRFPADLAGQLGGRIPPPSRALAMAGRVFRLFPRPLWGLVTYPVHLLIGASLLMIASKRR
ncbi:MAG: hypothetical protein CUN53_00915 [Phototrophicales bacterium]|nr:MAG: hypothetical protein CUN53_00915 [Phototrophicales bacterium]